LPGGSPSWPVTAGSIGYELQVKHVQPRPGGSFPRDPHILASPTLDAGYAELALTGCGLGQQEVNSFNH